MSGIQSIRNTLTGNITKIIVGAIIITFIGSVGWAGFFSQGTANVVAKVGAQEITNADLSFELSSQQFALSQRFPDQEIEDEILLNLSTEVLIGKFSILDFLGKNDLNLTEDFIYKQLSTEEQFLERGSFNKERFDSFARSNGFIPSDYLQRVREDLSINIWRQAIANSVLVTNSETLKSYNLAEQARDISFIRIPEQKFRDAISFEEKDLENFYENNKDRYIEPAKAKVAFITLDAENIKDNLTVSEEEILVEYEEYLEFFDSTPRKQVSHIMLNLDEKRDLTEANRIIETIKNKLNEGESFSDLVKEFSEDEPTKESSGSLGETDGTMFPTEFELALDSMEEGDVYGPVELLSSVHLLKLNKIIKPIPDKLETKSQEIKERIASIKSEEEFVTLLNTYSDLAFGSDSIEEIASQNSLDLKVTNFFEEDNTPNELNVSSLKNYIFDNSIDNQFPEIIETSPLSAVLLQVTDFNDPTQLQFEDVKSEVQEAYISFEASNASRVFAVEAVNELNLDNSLESLSNDNKVEIETYKNLKRDSALLPVDAINEIFSLPRSNAGNTFGASLAQNGDYLIYRLDAVSESIDQVDEETLSTVADFLEQQQSISELSELQVLVQSGLSVQKFN